MSWTKTWIHIGRAAIAFGFCLAMFTATSGQAQPRYDERIYNPETKSYFEMIKTPHGQSKRGANIAEINWGLAQSYAQKRAFKGVNGRLAIVRSQATHDFLITSFHPPYPVWIGLRYMCQGRQLVWSDGQTHPANGYKHWAPAWSAGLACNYGQYAPVYYELINGVHYWRAQGQDKEFTLLFVEYPTGAP